MASVHKTKVGYEIRWRYQGRQFNQSVGNITQAEALGIAGRIDSTINAIKQGWSKPPAQASLKAIKAFVFSGGQDAVKTAIVEKAKPLTLSELFDLYRVNLTASNKDEASMKTEGYHINHVKRTLGQDRELESITLRDVQGYGDQRGKSVARETIRKEVQTFRFVWCWAHKRGHVTVGVPWTEKELTLPKAQPKENFRTMAEIQAGIARGLPKVQEKAWWDGLYLTGPELKEVLAFVQANATVNWLYPQVAMCIMTGCRRSEALRSEPGDFDYAAMTIRIREKKKNNAYAFTYRTVDMHEDLAKIMGGRDWFNGVTRDMTNDHLNRTLAKSDKWRNIKGFHVFRHSFASALAIKGIDQRVIDALLGHGTDEMSKRYRHIAKPIRQSAVDGLFS